MSKKTIVFKMPAAESPRRDDEPSDALAGREFETRETPQGAEPDQWVRRRDLNGSSSAHLPSAATPVGKIGLAIDLAVERDLGEVVALSLIVPPMLGWFWLANTMDRYRRIFAP
jgi:hypothetical protein